MIEALKAASKQEFLYPPFSLRWFTAGLEDKDQAFTLARKGLRRSGFTRLAYLKVEALWDPLRSDPRFGDPAATRRHPDVGLV